MKLTQKGKSSLQ